MVRSRRIRNSVFFLTFLVLYISLTSLPLGVHATDVEDLDDAAAVAEVSMEDTIIEAEDVAETEATVETNTAEGGVTDEAGSEEEAIKEEATEFIAAAETAAQEEADALKKSVVSRIASVTEKLKSSVVTKQNIKKTAALGVGVWGAATGVGWAMQNFGIGPMKD